MERKFRVLDPKAPSFYKGAYNILNNDSFYTDLRILYPELSIYDNSSIRRIIVAMNNTIRSEVLNNRNGVRLTEGLGVIVAGACKISAETARNNIDYKLSREMGKPIPISNTVSDNYISKIKYIKDINFKFSNLWCFDADRVLTRSIAKIFKTPGGYKKYIVFTSRQHIGHLLRPVKIAKRSKKAEDTRNKLLDNYNEFDI